MSHALALVVIPDDAADVEAAVKDLLAPYCEHDHEDGWWDWYVFGGRWRGVLPAEVGTLEELNTDSFTIVTADRVVHRETWNGSDWIDTSTEFEEFRATLAPDTRVAAIDYHS